ncbi:MAG TPA: tRNA (adenosine(37)-N6)-threonylcarbamoyltransferase complex transferase subunit TsaD, partial [Steroidobacteraceae bacterium]|nr:tRNA (adenosine(37)-N6)-threonylcarbamoyltransferase complex transferase subunit TsaD [Steroidobacteraceae bacterium]
GVGANRRLRERLVGVAAEFGARAHFPRPRFCTDNGAMIALAGCIRLRARAAGGPPGPARAHWPLDEAAL